MPRGIVARIYPKRKSRLRGVAPYGVRTFLLQLALKAILRPSRVVGNLDYAPVITRFRWEEDRSSCSDNLLRVRRA